MEVQSATRDHCGHVEEVARRSFQTSYSLSPRDIDTLVDHYFTEPQVIGRVESEGGFLLVAVDEDDVVGFAEVDAEQTLRWLHVEPTRRGTGAGTALLEQVHGRLREAGVPVTARILEAAREGRTFLEAFGLSQTGTAQLTFGSEQLLEYVYTTGGSETDANEPTIDVPETVSVDGRQLHVDEDDDVPGTEAPFRGVYQSDSDDSRWGYLCTECGSTKVSADGLDRLECETCGNTHLAEQWDGAYL